MAAITATPLTTRPHVMIAEVEERDGYRHWSAPMSKLELDLWLDSAFRHGAGLSDYCCAATCWCAE